jgi:hypothetical protein
MHNALIGEESRKYEPKSEKLFGDQWVIKKALVWALEMVREKAPGLEKVCLCCVGDGYGNVVGAGRGPGVGAKVGEVFG